MTLEDFGYRTLDANGTRPLVLLIVAGPEDPRFRFPDGSETLHDQALYEQLLFGRVHGSIFAQLVEENVVGYYQAVSNGRFGWSRAMPAHLPPIRISQQEAALDLPQRLGLIQEKAAARGFDLSSFDASHDSAVSTNELGVLVIDNSSEVGAATRGVDAQANGVHLQDTASAAGGRASFVSVCHELSHQLGTKDLYGATGLNQDCTLMCATVYPSFDDRRSYYLDAWHRMMLGWIEPQLIDITSEARLEILAASTAAPAQTAALLYDPTRGPSEYFLLEYRTRTPVGGNRYDADVASDGLAIWHVILDETKIPFEVPSLTKPGGTDKSVFLEGPTSDGTAGFARGANTLWSSGTTPQLRWLDGSPVGIRISIDPFASGAASLFVATTKADPRTSKFDPNQSTFSGIST